MKTCDCDDPFCLSDSPEGEVPGHAEDCSCSHCHRMMGKVSPFYTVSDLRMERDRDHENEIMSGLTPTL